MAIASDRWINGYRLEFHHMKNQLAFESKVTFVVIILVKIVGTHEGREFDNREITFVLGETGDDEKDGGCIVGIQEALIYFGKGEVSR